MTLLTTGGRRRNIAAAPPYTIPTAAPYNVPEHATTPTYDGSGNTVHVDVIDFLAVYGLGHWRGYRFWMAHTPYPNSDDTKENPSILASHDGLTWQKPDGLTADPLYTPPPEKWNSDTDLVYDEAADELVVIFRRYEDGQHRHMYARSSDGITWPATASRITGWSQPAEELLSPAVLQLADGTWALFDISVTTRTVRRWLADSPEGPYAPAEACTGFGADAWHLDVIRVGSKLYALIDEGRERSWMPDDPQGLYAASSTDNGLTWTRNETTLIALGSGLWDDFDLYRGGLQPHENGTHMRVWYCGRKGTGTTDSWHVGLTHIPLSEWP